MPLTLFPSAARRQRAYAVMVCAVLGLAGCGMTRPSPSAALVHKPPQLSQPDESAAAPASPTVSAQNDSPHTTVQALLTRADVSVRLIDAGRGLQLWPWAATFLQASGQRDRILADIAQARAALGPVQGRSRAGAQGVQAVRIGPESQRLPPGQYANVEYMAQLARGGSAIERLSFRLEPDGWRFTGYTTQAVPQDAALPSAAPAAAAPPAAAGATR